MVRKIALSMILLILLSGCSAHIGKSAFEESIYQLEQALKVEDKAAIKQQIDTLVKVYDTHEWKLQLIGDEGEYEGLHENIHRLITAIEIEEYKEALLELGSIKSILEEIYSL